MDYTAPPPIRVDSVTQEHLNEVSLLLTRGCKLII